MPELVNPLPKMVMVPSDLRWTNLSLSVSGPMLLTTGAVLSITTGPAFVCSFPALSFILTAPFTSPAPAVITTAFPDTVAVIPVGHVSLIRMFASTSALEVPDPEVNLLLSPFICTVAPDLMMYGALPWIPVILGLVGSMVRSLPVSVLSFPAASTT